MLHFHSCARWRATKYGRCERFYSSACSTFHFFLDIAFFLLENLKSIQRVSNRFYKWTWSLIYDFTITCTTENCFFFVCYYFISFTELWNNNPVARNWLNAKRLNSAHTGKRNYEYAVINWILVTLSTLFF